MAPNIGKQLYDMRVGQGLTLDDVHHKTRIPPARLMELENDDYSNFANPTYAKSFLALYSRYLNVDITQHAPDFHHGRKKVNGHAYLQTSPGVLTSTARKAFEPARGRLRLAMMIFVIGGAVSLAFWYGNRPTADRDAKSMPGGSARATAAIAVASPHAAKSAQAFVPADRLASSNPTNAAGQGSATDRAPTPSDDDPLDIIVQAPLPSPPDSLDSVPILKAQPVDASQRPVISSSADREVRRALQSSLGGSSRAKTNR
ncbi:MAG: helix-turn-helix domain-containing protein [Verrucomicrobiales bacterium]